jgi:curved DNA-binding protein CbpA
MSCDCAQCRQHYKTLGFMFGLPSESEIQEAYHESVKQWHPDLYENYASLRADAEEHFKQIQVAYRELKEHNSIAGESPAENAPVEGAVVQPKAETPYISFGGAPGCLTAPHFTPQAEEIIAQHLGKLGTALAIIDLTGARSQTGNYAQFLLLAELGIMVRDARNIVSLLWYKDLGEINLIDKNKPGKPGLWQSLAGGVSSSRPKFVLEIYRSNGMLFHSISGQADESVKKVVYDFLQRKKY